MGIKLDNSDNILGITNPNLKTDNLLKFIEVPLNNFFSESDHLGSKISKDFNSKDYNKYLLGVTNDNFYLLIVDSHSLNAENQPRSKVYSLSVVDEGTGTFLKINKIEQISLEHLKLQAKKMMSQGKESPQLNEIKDILRSRDKIIAHHSPPSSPRSEDENDLSSKKNLS